ncbi:MAG TPA: WHG domain-containing protein [Candidatus Sulfomarinibacteraceae bacterium]|nr:WHG domain-containing protein [Candidatus Sulfomarinibacteraceae bacterium]
MAKRRRLSRQRLIEQAAQMMDAAGDAEALTLTALARALNVRTPSLYNHIDSLQDLNQALATFAAQRLLDRLRQAATGKVGSEALLSVARAYRRFAHEHPGIYPLTTRAPEPQDEALSAVAQELLQMLLLVLASCGLQGDEALHAIRGFRALLHGFVALEAGEGYKMDLDRDESFERAVLAYVNGLP